MKKKAGEDPPRRRIKIRREFDKDLFKDEEDRKWMMQLSEVDRQGILAERQEKQNIAREAWQLEHMKKKAGEDPPRRRIKIRRQRKLDDTGTIEQVTDPLCSSVIWKIPQASQMWTHVADKFICSIFRYFLAAVTERDTDFRDSMLKVLGFAVQLLLSETLPGAFSFKSRMKEQWASSSTRRP